MNKQFQELNKIYSEFIGTFALIFSTTRIPEKLAKEVEWVDDVLQKDGFSTKSVYDHIVPGLMEHEQDIKNQNPDVFVNKEVVMFQYMDASYVYNHLDETEQTIFWENVQEVFDSVKLLKNTLPSLNFLNSMKDTFTNELKEQKIDLSSLKHQDILKVALKNKNIQKMLMNQVFNPELLTSVFSQVESVVGTLGTKNNNDLKQEQKQEQKQEYLTLDPDISISDALTENQSQGPVMGDMSKLFSEIKETLNFTPETLTEAKKDFENMLTDESKGESCEQLIDFISNLTSDGKGLTNWPEKLGTIFKELPKFANLFGGMENQTPENMNEVQETVENVLKNLPKSTNGQLDLGEFQEIFKSIQEKN